MAASKDYWEKRAEEKVLSVEQMGLDFERRLRKRFRDAATAIDGEIMRLYAHYAKNGSMTYADALGYLTTEDRAEFQATLQEYIDRASDPDYRERHRQELLALSVRARVRRLEAMDASIKMEAEKLYSAVEADSTKMLAAAYDAAYKRTAFDIFQTLGFGAGFSVASPGTLQKLLEFPWSGRSYSANIWDLERGFVAGLDRVLTTGLIRGQSVAEMSHALHNAALGKGPADGGEMKRAQRLIRTETSFILNQATGDMYDELGVDEYEFLGTLDSSTCESCGGLDGKHWPVSEQKIGVNYPPLHPNCRCTTIPYFEDLDEFGGSRIARGADGENYYVPGDMTYAEWREGLQNDGKGGIIYKTGAISGAHNPDSDEAQIHAQKYYGLVRSMKTDVAHISRNTGFSESSIALVKQFVFFEKHDLGGNDLEYFDPSYRMAESWRRLIDGKEIQPHDITMLEHEIMERRLMSDGLSQEKAHEITNAKYNYRKEADAYYAQIEKHKTD